MENLFFRLPHRVLFGRGSLAATGAALKELGERALICTDTTIAQTDTAERVRRSLREAGISIREFAETQPEIPLSCLEECVAFASEQEVDMVIGLGGGSCIDIAKATALLLADPGPIQRFYGENQIAVNVLPIVGIPTTAGTGSEVTPGAVFVDPDRRLKVGVNDVRLIPQVAICDPEATLSCPPSVTGFSGADALVHAVESYCAPVRDNGWDNYPGDVYRGRQSLTRHYSLIALERIARSFERAYNEGSDIEAREDMLFASLCAGIAFSHSGCASAHALQYPVGGATHTPHGLGVALLLPFTLEIARPEADTALVDIARAMGVIEPRVPVTDVASVATASIDEIERITRAVGVPRSLEDIGVKPEDLGPFAIDGIGISRLVRNSPRAMTEEDFVKVLSAALEGIDALFAEQQLTHTLHHSASSRPRRARMTFDLVLKGGHVFDPGQDIDATLDIGILNGAITALAPNIVPENSNRVLDVGGEGRYIVPGLIDLHTHSAHSATTAGVGLDCCDPDFIGVRSGVTTLVDAGSVGVANVGVVGTYVIPRAETRVLCFVNAGSYAHTNTGLLDVNSFEEIDRLAIASCVEANPELISGVKLRMMGEIMTERGEDVVRLVKEIGRELQVPIMVHIGDMHATSRMQSERMDVLTRFLLRHLEPGDILTHLCTPHHGGVLDNQAQPLRELHEARKVGVVLDSALGRGNFGYKMAAREAEIGLYPDTISTDLSTATTTFHSLVECMAKFMAIGYSFADVVRMTTVNAAQALGLEAEIGSIAIGREANISILDLHTGAFRFLDTLNVTFRGRFGIVPVQTVRAGKLFEPHWGTHPWGWLPETDAADD